MTREEIVTLLENYDKLKPKNAKFVVCPRIRYGGARDVAERIDFDAYKLHKTKDDEWEDFVCTLLTVNLHSYY